MSAYGLWYASTISIALRNLVQIEINQFHVTFVNFWHSQMSIRHLMHDITFHIVKWFLNIFEVYGLMTMRGNLQTYLMLA